MSPELPLEHPEAPRLTWRADPASRATSYLVEVMVASGLASTARDRAALRTLARRVGRARALARRLSLDPDHYHLGYQLNGADAVASNVLLHLRREVYGV